MNYLTLSFSKIEGLNLIPFQSCTQINNSSVKHSHTPRKLINSNCKCNFTARTLICCVCNNYYHPNDIYMTAIGL